MPYAAADKILPANIMTPPNTVLHRRGSLIQRRNSKRFVLHELDSAAAAVLAAAAHGGPPTRDRAKSVDNKEENDKDFMGIPDEEVLSDDDDVIKVPDIVLDIREASSPVPTTDSSEPYSPETWLDLRSARLLRLDL